MSLNHIYTIIIITFFSLLLYFEYIITLSNDVTVMGINVVLK